MFLRCFADSEIQNGKCKERRYQAKTSQPCRCSKCPNRSDCCNFISLSSHLAAEAAGRAQQKALIRLPDLQDGGYCGWKQVLAVCIIHWWKNGWSNKHGFFNQQTVGILWGSPSLGVTNSGLGSSHWVPWGRHRSPRTFFHSATSRRPRATAQREVVLPRNCSNFSNLPDLRSQNNCITPGPWKDGKTTPISKVLTLQTDPWQFHGGPQAAWDPPGGVCRAQGHLQMRGSSWWWEGNQGVFQGLMTSSRNWKGEIGWSKGESWLATIVCKETYYSYNWFFAYPEYPKWLISKLQWILIMSNLEISHFGDVVKRNGPRMGSRNL